MTAVIGGVAAIAAAIEERVRVRARTIAAPVVVLLVVAASLTGQLLPWDALALWAVTVGTNHDGFEFVIDSSQIRHVIVDGTEVSVSTFARWFWTHAALLPVLATGAGVVLWRSLGRPAGVTAEEGEEPVLG